MEVRVKRFSGILLAVTVLAGLTAACADQQVSITNSDSLVSSCQKVGDVAVSPNVPNDHVNDELTSRARATALRTSARPRRSRRSKRPGRILRRSQWPGAGHPAEGRLPVALFAGPDLVLGHRPAKRFEILELSPGQRAPGELR